MSTVTLLGPQIREPNLRAVVCALGLPAPYAAVTAGWQEREGELDELRSHFGEPVEDLRLYARTEEVFSSDPELRLAHRRRQARLLEMQEIYRLRLGHAKHAARELLERSGDPRILKPARRQAIAALRRLDHAHLEAIRRVHAEFAAEWDSPPRRAVRRAREDARRAVEAAGTVLVAGGHVAVLLNRLRLFGGASLFSGRPVVAWSAGAMALCESVVLYQDHAPHGATDAEVFDTGLGLVRRAIVFPHARSRLRLHDGTRVALLASRFAPASCYTLDEGSCLHFRDGALVRHASSWRLTRQGALGDLAAA